MSFASKSQILRFTALATVLAAGLSACSDGSDDGYFGWGDPGAWYESTAVPGEDDPNLEGSAVPSDRLPEAQRPRSSDAGLDLGSSDAGVDYAGDLRGSESGTVGGSSSMASSSASSQEPSPLIAAARQLGDTPPAPIMDAPKASAPMQTAATDGAYTDIPPAKPIGGVGALPRQIPMPKKVGDDVVIPKAEERVVARVMDRGNINIPGPMPFSGVDGTVAGAPTLGSLPPKPVEEPADMRMASSEGGASTPNGPRRLPGFEGDARPMPTAASGVRPANASSRYSVADLLNNEPAQGATSLEQGIHGSFDQSYMEMAGRDVSSDAVTVDLAAIESRKAAVPSELIEGIDAELGVGNPAYMITRGDLRFEGDATYAAPSAAPTARVERRQQTLGALIPPEQQAAPKGAYIPFATGSVRLSAADRDAINKLAAMLSGTDRVVRIVGHADTPRTDIHDGVQGYALSLERANKVASALVAAGVDKTQIRVEARGVTGARRAELYFE